MISEKLLETYITMYAGYINYFLKNTYGGGSDGYIPLLNGIEQGFLHKFFASVQFGYYFLERMGWVMHLRIHLVLALNSETFQLYLNI